MSITDQEQIIVALQARIEELEAERDGLQVAIAEHVEALGHEGNDAAALRDSLGQLERLLEGKDLGADFEGFTGQVEALVWLFKFDTTNSKAPKYLDRLPIALRRQVAGFTAKMTLQGSIERVTTEGPGFKLTGGSVHDHAAIVKLAEDGLSIEAAHEMTVSIDGEHCKAIDDGE